MAKWIDLIEKGPGGSESITIDAEKIETFGRNIKDPNYKSNGYSSLIRMNGGHEIVITATPLQILEKIKAAK